MTKIKNTKKGMAKKTLSMSLVVAMLATSNVPVWAAEFSDGSDAAVATEAPAVDAQATDVDTFTDDTDTAPVVDDTEAVDAQAVVENSDEYAFSNIKLTDDATNFSWGKFDGQPNANINSFFKDGSVITDANSGHTLTVGDYKADKGLKYVFRYGGTWDETPSDFVTSSLSNADPMDLSKLDIEVPTQTSLRANAGKTFDMLILGKDDKGDFTKVVCTIPFGTIQKVDLNTVIKATAPSVTYNGLKQQIAPTSITNTKGWGLKVGDFDWTYISTEGNYTDAGVKVTVTGKLKDNKVQTGFTDTITTSYVIAKRDLTQDAKDVVVKLKNPGKDFEYQNNVNTEIDKSEVDVFLRDLSDEKTAGSNVSASAVSLNDYVKKVTINTTSLGEKVVNVEFDANALKASKNFTADAPTGVTSLANKETATETKNANVNVVALDLSKCDVSVKPVQAAKTISPSDLTIVVTKDGKTLTLNAADYTKTVKSGDYSTPGTYTGAITVSGTGNVTGSKTIDLVTVKQAFKNAKFEGSAGVAWTDYLADKASDVYTYLRKYGLDYNNGKAVEFADMFTKKCILGRFSPDGSSYGDQDNFRVTYENNVNATNADSVAKLTVTAIAGDYKGCSQDFYFRINPSQVVLSTNSKINTVTTAVKKEAKGVSYNSSYTTAEQYADAIGLVINGTNDPTNKLAEKDKIVSNTTANDYKVEYSFVKADKITEGENEVKDFIKVVATLKEKGNFEGNNTPADVTFDNNVSGTIASKTGTNGVITLYIPIVDKSIDTLDISLKEDTFTFTGETIKPEVIVKENGKVLKDAATIEGITDGINAGTATIKVSVDGYTGTKELKATINPAKLSDVVFEIKKANKDDFTYNGKQQKPVIAQEDDPTTAKDETIAENDPRTTADVKLGSVIISKMFDIKYGENINAGEKAGSVTLTPKTLYAKNFDGTSITANFDILRAVLKGSNLSEVLNIKDTTGKKVTIHPYSSNNDYGYVDEADSLEWTGDVAKFASVTVDYKKLSSSTGVKFNDDDYELVYVNATDATASWSPAYIAVIGKGNFKGEYSIVKEEISDGNEYNIMLTTEAEKAVKENPGVYTIVQSDVIAKAVAEYNIVGGEFTAKNITYSNGTYAGGLVVKPVVTVKDAKTGATLTEGTDYKVIITTDPNEAEPINAGSRKYEFAVIGLGKYTSSRIFMKDGKELTYSVDKKDLKDCYVNVDKKDGKLELTVMNGNIVEKKENFDLKDNGDGTATVSVVDGGKNYTGSVSVQISDADAKVGTPLLTNVIVKGNTATPVLSSEVDGAVGYDYVIATEEDYKNGRIDVSKNVLKTNTKFYYVQEGTYYAYCHAWKRDENNKKVFGEWSNIYKFTVTATTPATPQITSVSVKGNTVTVKYTKSADATGYDVVLGSSVKKVNGESRPVDYGTLVKKNIKGNVVTATFKNVPTGKYYAGLHSFNKTSEDGSKVFSKWSKTETVTVK